MSSRVQLNFAGSFERMDRSTFELIFGGTLFANLILGGVESKRNEKGELNGYTHYRSKGLVSKLFHVGFLLDSFTVFPEWPCLNNNFDHALR